MRLQSKSDRREKRADVGCATTSTSCLQRCVDAVVRIQATRRSSDGPPRHAFPDTPGPFAFARGAAVLTPGTARVSALASDRTVARTARRSTRTLTIVPWSSTGYWMTSATHGPGAARPDLIATPVGRTRRPRWCAFFCRSIANCAKGFPPCSQSCRLFA